ncbi:MAG: cobalamin adenosyltransferase [Synergistaceae bacterium]|jgi:ethanolamine utilization cobalamin adenosyltransferase|nr:cobalamin adenosyltransferase [Synergistaceae bacterium]
MTGKGSMNILNESMLRASLLDEDARRFCVERGTFVTPLAREYLRDRGIELVFGGAGEGMPYTPIEYKGERTFVDARSGAGFEEKPERMTHLFGNQLVPKTHPRIALRGKLDTLQSEIILTQAEAIESGMPQLVRDLDDLLALAREIMGAEVAGRDLRPRSLFGYDLDELRHMSHHVKEHFGFPHPVPNYAMGRTAARLNLLRAESREVELAAEHAFGDGERADILTALNRLSSAIYVLLCRLLDGGYGR